MADNTLDPTDDLVALFSLWAEPLPSPPPPIRPMAQAIQDVGLRKRCSGCREHKAGSEFPRNATLRSGLDSQCRKCVKAYKAKLRQKPDQKLRNAIRHRESTYGVTQQQYETMLAAQNGQCAICRKEFKSAKLTHVDHCHTTGEVRGLLCIRCNSEVGLVENEQKMAAIKSYIQSWMASEKVA